MRYVQMISAMLLLLSSAVAISSEDDGRASALVSHSPIDIDGNSELDSMASMQGWAGDGTENNPYMIQNYDIAAYTWAIRVRDTDRHLIIFNCHGRDGSRSGILLDNVRNASILDSRWTENEDYGIHLRECQNVVVDGNRFDATMVMVNNYNHIVLERSSRCRISNNTVVFSQNDGIQLMDNSEHNVVENNYCKNMYKAIYVNSEHNTIIYNTGDSNSYGVYLERANNTVSNNSMFYNAYGVYSYFSGYNLICNNTCQRNYVGIYVNFAHDQVIRNNLLLKNSNYGVYIYADLDGNNKVYLNDLFYNNNSGASFDPDRVQCRDRFGGNQWNDTYGRGNFWWDWREPDIDGDGIVDDPYPISGTGVFDHFPLTTSDVPDTSQPPQDVSATGGSDFINLSWSPPQYSSLVAIGSYRIYRGLRAGGESVYLNVDGNDTFLLDYDVTEGDRYYYYITAVTDIGESNRSARRSAVPDGIAPTVDIQTGDGLFTANDWFRVKWSGSDNVGIVTYEVALDGSDPLDVGKVNEYTFGDLGEGGHAVEVIAYDEGMNVGRDSIAFHVDLTDPWLNITAPSIEPAAVVNLTSFDLEWVGGDDLSGLSHYDVRVFGGEWTSVDNALSFHVVCQNDVWHFPSVRAVDLAGNTAEASLAFYVDIVRPGLDIVDLGGFYIDSTSRFINWTYQDADSGLKTVEVSLDGAEWEDIGLKDNITLENLTEGPHTFKVRVWDMAGNHRSDEVSFVVDISGPVLEITSPEKSLLNSSNVDLIWTGGDDHSPMSRYGLRIDAGPWRWVGLNTSFTFTELEDGYHFVDVQGVDMAGNRATANVSFYTDTEIPRVLERAPGGNSVEPNVTFMVVFSEQMDRSRVVMKVRGAPIDLIWNGTAALHTPSNPLTRGSTYDVVVLGFDLAGNEMTPYTWTFRVKEEDLTRTCFFIGMVVDRKGNGLADAGISVNITTFTRTDENGYFRLKVEPGLHTLTVAKDDYEMITINGYVEVGQTRNLGEIVMESSLPEEKEEGPNIGLMAAVALASMFLMVVIVILIVALNQRRLKYPIFIEDEGWMRMYPHRK